VSQRLAGVGSAHLGDGRGARLHRLERIGGDRQDLVLHVDQVERFLGDRELVGGDGATAGPRTRRGRSPARRARASAPSS